MIYEECGDHRGRADHAIFFIFELTVQRIRMFCFSLKPFAPPGESSLEISAR